MEHLPVPRLPLQNEAGAIEPTVIRPISVVPAYGGYPDADSEDTSSDLGQLLQYWHVLTRRKLTLLVVAICGGLAALAFSVLQTPIYRTGVTLEIQQTGFQQQPFQEMSSTQDPTLLQTQTRLLTSRMLQGRVHAKLSDRMPTSRVSDSSFLTAVRGWLGLTTPTRSAAWTEALERATGDLQVTAVKDTRIVQIVCSTTLPQAAADYANTLAEEFIQESLEQRWSLYQGTGVWLERAQQELKGKLEQAEKQLLDYASASNLVVVGKENNIGEQRLVQLQVEASKAQADRIAKESSYRTALSQSGSEGEVLDSGAMAQYETTLANLHRELAEASTSLTSAHPKVKRLQAQIEEMESSRVRERTNILSRMRADYESALHRERQLMADFNTQSKTLSEEDQKLIRYRMLQREVDTYRSIYETTLKAGKEASVASALRPVTARIVDRAGTPRFPIKPNLTVNLMVGSLGGVFLGVALVLFRDRTDATIRTPGSLSVYPHVRELGVIPCASVDPEFAAIGWRPRLALPPARSSRNSRPPTSVGVLEPVELASWNWKESLLAESFRATLTSIFMSGQNGSDRQILLVTSPSPREGKSTVATNLAIAIAEIRQRVLLIDADLRRPRIHSIFDQANTWGLSDLLKEETPCAEYPSEALGRKTHVPSLFSMPSGPANPSVARLLYSDRMAELVGRLRTEFDTIVIDTPPVLSVADARILSRLADAVVLVVRAGQTTREAATMAMNVFEADGVPVLGTVLNDWNPTRKWGAYGHSLARDADYYRASPRL